MTEFPTWDVLTTYAGATAMVGLVISFIKNMRIFKKIPTQLLSYFCAIILLFLAIGFTTGLSLPTSIEIFFHAIIISMASNGGYHCYKKVCGENKKGDL